MNVRKRTACDVLAEAKKKYMNPAKLTKEEVDSLAEDLYGMVEELHGMAESMEARLNEYHDFANSLKNDVDSLLKG